MGGRVAVPHSQGRGIILLVVAPRVVARRLVCDLLPLTVGRKVRGVCALRAVARVMVVVAFREAHRNLL